MDSEHVASNYDLKVASATAALKARDFRQARVAIADAMGLNMDAPEPHNLLGILYEMLGDYQAARRHYRAEHALDPVYKPCCRNLERITSFDSASFLSGRVFDTAEAEAQHTEKRLRPAIMKR